MGDVFQFRVGFAPTLVSQAPPGRLRVAAVPLDAERRFACSCGQRVRVSALVWVYDLAPSGNPGEWFLYVLGRCSSCGRVLGDWEHEEPEVRRYPLSLPPESYLPWVAWRAKMKAADMKTTTRGQKSVVALWSRQFDADEEDQE